MTDKAATALRKEWHDNPRWKGIKRPYKAEDVIRLRGNVQIDHTLAHLGMFLAKDGPSQPGFRRLIDQVANGSGRSCSAG